MPTRTCRVGLHGRNDVTFEDVDYQVIQEAKIETVKMMSHTEIGVFRRLHDMNVELITRLHDDRIGKDSKVTAQQFVDRMVPVMNERRPYCEKFQIHNEPNHLERKEGWGPEEEDAKDFNLWFQRVYTLLKQACPWAELGFPGLAVPGRIGHRDKRWLKVCRDAIQMADWLGVHAYWQSPPGQPSQMFDPDFGLTYTYYHDRYPNKPLEILECGNSNYHTEGYPVNYDDIAREYVEWLQKVFEHPRVRSASFFILSNHYGPVTNRWEDWWPFSWRTRDRNPRRNLVQAVGQMHRPQWVAKPQDVVKPKPKPKPVEPAEPKPQLPPGQWTNQQVITAFANAAKKLGLGNWVLMNRAGIKLDDLARDRNAPYQGPAIDQLPNLSEEEKGLVLDELAKLAHAAEEEVVSFDFGQPPENYLWKRPDLATIDLSMPLEQRIDLSAVHTDAAVRVATIWNQYGFLLMQVATILKIDLGVATAVLAAQAEQPGLARDGRPVIRFENHLFHQEWGRQNEDVFRQHFQFGSNMPWLWHRWRPNEAEPWSAFHGSQEAEWQVFEFARSLDESAVLAIEAGPQGLARDGRLIVRFENHVFYDKWGRENGELFEQHFLFDPDQPWQRHEWRPSVQHAWRDPHSSQTAEWEVFEFASTLDGTAAKLSTAMGLTQLMGFNYVDIGYESVEQMFDDFSSSERYQVLAVFDFIAGPWTSSRQLRALQAEDLDGFAALHYGSSQAVRYGSVLRSLYEAFEELNPLR